uniref:RiboL-PSP-HEPN domain-containing protein n=1 Tax=Caulobacter sp. (strain K31) TaxID=366602 RepID=B0SWQ2_CAUSK
MPEPSNFLDDLDAARLRRARELSEIKVRFIVANDGDAYSINSKATIVLAYSHWEGFYNECISTYLNFLQSKNLKVREAGWSMVTGSISSALSSLKDRSHSTEARCDFVDALEHLVESSFETFDASVVSARSNLDFSKLKENFRILGFDISPFNKYRNRLNKELVGWRHSIAHGDVPDLSDLSIESHIILTNSLLLTLSDLFQERISLRQ